MLVDSRQVQNGQQFDCDLCIIGAGAAGITIARALKSTGLSICLLESGAFDRDERTQALYRGPVEGSILSQYYQETSRLRYFGGTTNHWTGWCRPLDEMDFERRSWIPGSGWPIKRADLAPFYQRAAEIVQVEPFDADFGDITARADRVVPPSANLVAKQFRYSPPTRFGQVYRQEIVDSSVRLLLHANVVNIGVTEAGNRVDRVQVATFNGRRFTVRPRAVVLATGAIENARILLISDQTHSAGLGNYSDCVGRYFMEHVVVGGGLACITSPEARDVLDTHGLMLAISSEAQRAHGLLNVMFEFNRWPGPERSEEGTMTLDFREFFRRIDTMGKPEAAADGSGLPYYRFYSYSETAPRPDNRVTLLREVDALGVRKAQLAWKTSLLEAQSIQQAKRIVGLEFGKRQIGRVFVDLGEQGEKVPLEEPPWERVHLANHHIGTTRMSATPGEGVVDPDCQVHGVENLFVAGSSVFTAAGCSNPTFTIVALALRLADHLEARLGH